MFLLTSLVGCCKAAPSWSKRWLLTSRGCSALKKAFFSSEPCRWHSEPCVSNSVRSHCLPFPALYSAEAVAMAKTLGRYGETRWFSFRCVNIFWMLSHHFQAKVEKECAANLLNIIIFFFSYGPYVFSVRQVLLSENLFRSHWSQVELIWELWKKCIEKGFVACRATGNSCSLALALTLLLFMALGKSLNFLISGSVSLPVKEDNYYYHIPTRQDFLL